VEVLRQINLCAWRELTQLSAHAEPRELLTLFQLGQLFLLGCRVGGGGSGSACFGRVILKLAFRDLVTTFATEEAKCKGEQFLVITLHSLTVTRYIGC
jgi:hypothetical protein